MAATMPLPTATEPFPIFKLACKYLIYDAATVAYARREYNISGVLIGGLPQAPQQNVFSGLPLELMPEEARLLTEKGVAYVHDDVVSHKRAFLENGLSVEERRAYQAALRKQGLTAAKAASKRGDDKKKAALARKVKTGDWNDVPEDMLKSREGRGPVKDAIRPEDDVRHSTGAEDETLFALAAPPSSPDTRKDDFTFTNGPQQEPYFVTPTTSYPPLQSSLSPSVNTNSINEALASYPLYKHLHDKGYFLSPGLRFGCQYVAYPGDPLRFHAHFLCNGMDWDQEFDLLDLIGGGRLGTGVKKGFMIGGSADGSNAAMDSDEPRSEVRSFCIEWGGM